MKHQYKFSMRLMVEVTLDADTMADAKGVIKNADATFKMVCPEVHEVSIGRVYLDYGPNLIEIDGEKLP